jgi:hypothetical protein
MRWCCMGETECPHPRNSAMTNETLTLETIHATLTLPRAGLEYFAHASGNRAIKTPDTSQCFASWASRKNQKRGVVP